MTASARRGSSRGRVLLFGALALVALVALFGATRGRGARPPAPTGSRIVCVGGALTEIVYALDAGSELVAVDDGSSYPEAALALPKLGYQRSLSAEGVLALAPTLVLLTPDAGPPGILAQLRAAGVAVHVIEGELSPAGAQARILAVGAAIGRQSEAAACAAALRADIARAEALLAEHADGAPPRVLCLYARARGTLHVCGAGTALDAIARLAGGVNAVGDLSGSVPLGGEAAVAAAPDVLLVPRGSAELSGGEQALLDEAGLALTPAGRDRRVVVMDDLLLSGFGPRLGLALQQLVTALHAPTAAPRSEAPAAPSAVRESAR